MAKIAISLPDAVLQAVEKERKARGETRSAFFRRAVEAFLLREREAIERYVRGYQRDPETEEEIALAESTVQPALATTRWEDGAEG